MHVDIGLTLYKCYTNALCLLGIISNMYFILLYSCTSDQLKSILFAVNGWAVGGFKHHLSHFIK